MTKKSRFRETYLIIMFEKNIFFYYFCRFVCLFTLLTFLLQITWVNPYAIKCIRQVDTQCYPSQVWFTFNRAQELSDYLIKCIKSYTISLNLRSLSIVLASKSNIFLWLSRLKDVFMDWLNLSSESWLIPANLHNIIFSFNAPHWISVAGWFFY